MILTNIYITIMVGVILSLIFTEMTGVLPAGLVIPGYLSLKAEYPQAILLICLISVVTYFIVVFCISKITILYGKRKFVAMVSVGMILTYIIETVFTTANYGAIELVALGVVVPGMMANTIQRQGLVPTIVSTTILTVFTVSVSTLIIYIS